MKDFLTYNRREQRGILVLLAILIILVLTRIFLPNLFREKRYDFSAFEKEIAEFMANNAEDQKGTAKTRPAAFNDSDSNIHEKPAEIYLFNFDPNTLSAEKWKDLGLKDNIIRVIKKYLDKGGRFRQKEDLKKIFGLSEEDYRRLEPYINIQQEKKAGFADHSRDTFDKNNKPQAWPDQQKRLVEINSADTNDLVSIRGIGSYTAKKIVSYRDRLGGFVRKEQLLEIRGMDSARFEQIRDLVVIDSSRISKFDLNKATFNEMLKHPYFEFYLVKEIFNYRDLHGRFDSVADLKKIPVIYKELYEKISPYLKVE
jgi:competence protein ComEA